MRLSVLGSTTNTFHLCLAVFSIVRHCPLPHVPNASRPAPRVRRPSGIPIASLPSPRIGGYNRRGKRGRNSFPYSKRLESAGTAHQKTVLERQIAATDQQIDRLVYELYELTEEEIKIVEEATNTD